jgi:glyoxylase-like metal-dependent hydrolase (beta-lactamase superfamily II)
MRIGDIEILSVVDGIGRVSPTAAYLRSAPSSDEPAVGGVRGRSPQDWTPHADLLSAEGMLILDLGGFLVRTADRLVLVDTGMGRLDIGAMRGGELLSSLGALGVVPGDITDVVLTHLHWDHVGWTTQQGTIVFPNATYRCDRRDWEHFVGPDPKATKKLRPLEARLETWETSGPLLAGIDTLEAPGHTPGSTILVVSSGVERALLLGDVVHCAVELVDDEWAGLGDVDPALAQRTRVALARELEGVDVPMAGAHFPELRFGRLLAGEGSRSWVFDA